MQCTTCNLEYVEYSSISAHKIYNKHNNNIQITISVMACPRCSEINESTIQVIDLEEEI